MKPTTELRTVLARSFFCALALVAASPVKAVVIDEFTTNQANLSDPPGGATNVSTAGADILDQRRGLSVDLLAGAGPVTAGVSGGNLTFTVTATTPDSRGAAFVTWDGDTNPNVLSPTGLNGEDLVTAANHSAFRINVASAAAGTELVLEVYTDANNVSRAARRIAAPLTNTDVFLSYENDFVVARGTGADFTDVGAIVLTVRGTETAASINRIETAAPSLTITKRDLDLSNAPITGPQLPGTTYKYRVTITNTGGEAIQLDLDDMVDANTTLDATSVDATPVAVPDAYKTAGHVARAVPAPGLLANDSDPDTQGGAPELEVTTVGAIATALGGTATIAADGGFTYRPPVGVGPAVDSFSYTIEDNEGHTASAIATVNIGPRIWFVDDADPGGANLGTFDDPFTAITATNLGGAGGTGDQDAPDDLIFFFSGSHASVGLPLENGQRVIGEGAGLMVDDEQIVPPGTAPTLTNAAGSVFTLAANNHLLGVDIGNRAAGGFAILGSNFGTLTVDDISINGTGGALDLTNGTVAAVPDTFHFDGISSTNSSGRGINLDTVSGTLSVNGSTSITDSAGAGIRVVNGGSTYNFGTTTLSSTGSGVELMNNATSTLSFSSLAVTTDAGPGLLATNSGTLQISGTGNTISATGGAGVSAASTSFGSGVTFSTVSSSGSPNNGINLDNVSGSFTANGGSITTAAGNDVDINAGSSAITYAGSITNTAARSVEVTARTGGTVTLSGTINDTGTGINVANNTGGTINFSGSTKTLNTGANAAVTVATNTGANVNFTGGGLSVTTTSGTGFSATGGGNLSIQGTGNIVTTMTATALNVNATTIAAAGLTFQRLASNGGSAPGIILDGTGSNAGLTVTGTGSAGSGGTIANKTGADGATNAGIGIYLNNTRSVSLSHMQLNDFENYAIRGTTVNGFSLMNSVINGNNGTNHGLPFAESSVSFLGLTGAATVANCNISGGRSENIRVINDPGMGLVLNRLTISDSTFGAVSATGGNDSVLIESNNGTVNVTVEDNVFTSARGDLLQLNLVGAAVSDLVMTGNQFSNNHSAIVGGGVTIGGGGPGSSPVLTYNITNNTFRDARGDALVVLKGSGAGNFSGTIQDNTIGVPGIVDSGAIAGSGIAMLHVGGGTSTVTITGNDIYQYNNFGILVQAGDSASSGHGTFNATVTGNLVANPGSGIATGSLAINGFHLNSGLIAADQHQVCLRLGGPGAQANMFTGSGKFGGTDFRLRQRQMTTVRLPGYAGANNNDSAVTTFVQGNNGGTPTGSVTNTVPPGGGYIGTGTTCP